MQNVVQRDEFDFNFNQKTSTFNNKHIKFGQDNLGS